MPLFSCVCFSLSPMLLWCMCRLVCDFALPLGLSFNSRPSCTSLTKVPPAGTLRNLLENRAEPPAESLRDKTGTSFDFDALPLGLGNSRPSRPQWLKPAATQRCSGVATQRCSDATCSYRLSIIDYRLSIDGKTWVWMFCILSHGLAIFLNARQCPKWPQSDPKMHPK